MPDETVRKIPTDGLVLKGYYSTITLAVYGVLTNNISEQIVQPVVNPALPAQPNTIADAQQIISGTTIESDWQQENIQSVPIEYNSQQATSYHQNYTQPETYNQEFNEFYNEVPKDPRNYHHTPETEWESKGRSRNSECDRDRDSERDRERNRDLSYQKTGSLEREHRIDSERRDRDREKRYSRSRSRDRDRPSREYREISRERDHECDWDRERFDYRSRERERERERPYNKHDENYRRSYSRDEREERKRPRTPPISPKRPHTPHSELKEQSPPEMENLSEEEHTDSIEKRKDKDVREDVKPKSPVKEVKEEQQPPPSEETSQMDVEEFEPILSDEDILDDTEQYADLDYDYTAYTNNDDIIKIFAPGVTELNKYKSFKFKLNNNAENDSIEIDENLQVTIGIADDYCKSSLTKYDIKTFDRLNKDFKEEFIHLCDKLANTIGPTNVFCDIVKLYLMTKDMNKASLSANDKELVEQVELITETVADWLQIALSYEMANVQEQPAYKIRHIKCGVRLAEFCSSSSEFIEYMWSKDFNMHKILLDLYDQEFMALSIKLMVLKTLDAYLLHKFTIEKFLLGNVDNNMPKENGYFDSLPVSEMNGYKILVENIRKNPLVRLKFALNSILKKLNLYEILHKMHSILIKLRNNSHDISAEETNLITKSLDQILSYCQCGPFVLSQPKRFLPVSSQFEILRNETKNILVEYFKMFNLLQCFLLLLTYPSTLNLPAIKTPIFEIISCLLDSPEGLEYLSSNYDTINILLKCLLRSDDEMPYGIQECIDIRSHNLGLRISYTLQSLYHIECLLDIGKKFNYDFDAGEVIDQFHGLFCLSFVHIGKMSIAKVLGMNNNFYCLLQFLELIPTSSKDKSENQLARIKKSTGLAYIIDLIHVAVTTISNIPLLEKFSKQILQIINLQELFEDSVASKLNDLRSYCNPFENVTALAYDNIGSFLEIIEKLADNICCFPGSIITSLRIIEHLGISQYSNKAQICTDNPLLNYVELKYKHVILQLFSNDGVSLLTKLLHKICEHFEQPSLHTATFVSSTGLLVVNIIKPCVLLLKQMLAYVIQCQNVNFKDLTTISVYLQTYNLLNSFPTTSPGFYIAQEIKNEIINILLVYTQPISDEVHEKDSLNKTLWTQMCGEVIKYVTSAPYTFMSGLLIFSELLPLPLPIQTRDDLAKDEITWCLNLRKLWSAHLHPHSAAIQEMINRLCISTQPPLLNLLRRICVQLADLAANSAIMIARGILDSVYDVLVPKEDMKLGPCNGHVARLLNFFACLVTHSTIKCAVLYLIHSNSSVSLKTEEKYPNLIQAFMQVLKNNCTSNSHVQSQECILSIIQSFCDIEITLLQNPINDMNELTSELYVANSMPTKEHLLTFINIIVDHLGSDNSFVTYLPVVRTLLLLTEHDYGFYHLRETLIKRNDLFVNLLNKLSNNFSKSNAEYLSTLNTLMEFLRIILTTEENDGTLLYTPRSIKLSADEVKSLTGWSCNPEGKHPLLALEDTLKVLIVH